MEATHSVNNNLHHDELDSTGMNTSLLILAELSTQTAGVTPLLVWTGWKEIVQETFGDKYKDTRPGRLALTLLLRWRSVLRLAVCDGVRAIIATPNGKPSH